MTQKTIMVGRRAVSGALIGAAMASAGVAGATSAFGVIPGAPTWSESVMVLYFDEALRNGFSLRLSRYPERNATWVWVHVLLDGVLYAYTERATPCSPERVTADLSTAIYPAPGLEVRMTREGPSSAMTALSFTARVRGHKGRSGVDGPGDTPVVLEGVFHPGPLRGGSPDGRFERTGRIEASLRAGDAHALVSGVGKAHEQTQTAPRFDTPFTYAMCWGPEASLIGLLSPKGGYGDVELAGQDRAVKRFQIEAWAPTRRFVATLKDGDRVTGQAETLYRYSVPIFGAQWFGRIVRAEAEGRQMVGMINDWRPEAQPYGLS
jgi:hypothetical protein